MIRTTPDELSDESMLLLYDALGSSFWLRVFVNAANRTPTPLHCDVRFKGTINPDKGMSFELDPNEKQRAGSVFSLIESLLEEDTYKHTPFEHSSTPQTPRFTFSPGLVRFTFYGSTMALLSQLGRRGQYLDALRQIATTLERPDILNHLAKALQTIGKSMPPNALQDIQSTVNALRTHSGIPQQLVTALEAAVITGAEDNTVNFADTIHTLALAANADEVFATRYKKLREDMESLAKWVHIVIAYITKESGNNT